MAVGHNKKEKCILVKDEDSASSTTPLGNDGEERDTPPTSLASPPVTRQAAGNEEDVDSEECSSDEDVSSDSSSVTHTRHSKNKKKGKRHHSEEDDDDSSASISSASLGSSASGSSLSSSDEERYSSESEAEMIIGEEPTQELEEPLVRPAALRHSNIGLGRVDGRSTFFLTDGSHEDERNEEGGKRGTGDGGRPLMLTDRPSERDALPLFMDTLATIGTEEGGAARTSSTRTMEAQAASPSSRSRVRAAVLIGSLHHGKTSFLRLLLSGQKEGRSSPSRTSGGGDSSLDSVCGCINGNMSSFSLSASRRTEELPGYHQSVDEIERGVTIKSHILTTIARGSRISKSAHLLTLVDTPGHADLFTEAASAMRVADAAVLCVDVVESLLDSGEALIAQAVQKEHLPIILVLTKLDRLIVELKLPPVDAYRKLRHVIDTVNNAIHRYSQAASAAEDRPDTPVRSPTSTAETGLSSYLVSPENGTVCFSSAAFGICVSLETFAHKYADVYKGIFSPAMLSRVLWGPYTWEKNRFQPISSVRQKPSFVQFVLEPLYKIASHAVCGSGKASEMLGIEEEGGESPLLPRSPLLAMQKAMRYFCGAPGEEGLDILLAALPAPHQRSHWLLRQYQLAGEGVASASSVEPGAPLKDDRKVALHTDEDVEERPGTVFAIAPLVRLYKENTVAALVRVLRGTLRCRDSLVVVDDSCSEDAPYYIITIKQIFMLSPDAEGVTGLEKEAMQSGGRGRGFLPVPQARAHQVVFITGLGKRSGSHLAFIGGTAVASLLSRAQGMRQNEEGGDEEEEEEEKLLNWFSDICPSRHFTSRQNPLIHVDIELKDPKKLEVLKDCLQLLQRTTPGVDIHRQETGEFTLRGHGEFHLDVLLRELRQVLAPGIRLGVSPPYVSFTETVQEEEGILAMVGARRCTVGCVSGAISSSALAEAVASGAFPMEKITAACATENPLDPPSDWALWLREKYGLDALDAQHVMGLGPDSLTGPNLFIDDTLEEERQIAKDGLTPAHREAILAGFRAAVAAGPLVGEVVCGVRLQLIFADIDPQTKPSVVLANARTAARQALLGARPRLLEPILSCEILCSLGEEEGMKVLKGILEQRRGAVLYALPIPATTLIRYQALIPAIDSFGLETQIRMATHGQCFPSFRFCRWDVVPGDPFDATVKVGLLDPAQGHELARDFVLKTRFRKGLSNQLIGGEW